MQVLWIVLITWIQTSLSANFSCTLTGIRAVNEAFSGANHIKFVSNDQTFEFNGNISETEFTPILIANFSLAETSHSLSFRLSTDYETNGSFVFAPKCLRLHSDCYELFRFASSVIT